MVVIVFVVCLSTRGNGSCTRSGAVLVLVLVGAAAAAAAGGGGGSSDGGTVTNFDCS